MRQTQQVVQAANGGAETLTSADTQINGLTFVYSSSPREVENLVTREFHADPNLHKNSNVELVGDFVTGGSPSVSFDWTWKWKPPKTMEDRGGGWRNSCSVSWPIACLFGDGPSLIRQQFVEYDQRAHRLHTLASFSYWVASKSAVRDAFLMGRC